MAREQSDDASTRDDGGMLPEMLLSYVDRAVADAIRSLPIGMPSIPVPIPGGFVVVIVEARS